MIGGNLTGLERWIPSIVIFIAAVFFIVEKSLKEKKNNENQIKNHETKRHH